MVLLDASFEPVLAQRRIILPVLGGISGSKRINIKHMIKIYTVVNIINEKDLTIHL